MSQYNENGISAATAVAEIKEVSPRLAATHKRILNTVIWCCIGWPVFIYGMGFSDNMFLVLLGAVLVSAPMLYRMWKGGGLAGVFKLDTRETITTYSDGSKTSDGGYNSMASSLVMNIFLFLLLVFIGCLATLIYLIYLVIKYAILYSLEKEKPAFMQSAYPILIAGLIVLCCSPFVIKMLYAGQSMM
jgi:hypothetical protein